MQNIATDILLIELNDERRKHTTANKQVMQEICDELVCRGEYPEKSGINLSPLQMVENYGAYWHRFSEPLNCPKCQADLRQLSAGAPFKREIGHIHADRCIGFWCPDCHQQILSFDKKKLAG